jgi:hypothetical protein
MEGTEKEVPVGACEYTNAWKNCATCDFWQGMRRLDAGSVSVTVDSSAQGQCDGFWKGSHKMGNSKCTEWRRWVRLAAWSGETRTTYP